MWISILGYIENTGRSYVFVSSKALQNYWSYLLIILFAYLKGVRYNTQDMKRTYQPKNIKRIRKFGFMARSKSTNGKKVLARRRKVGRKNLSASEEYKTLRKKTTKSIR